MRFHKATLFSALGALVALSACSVSSKGDFEVPLTPADNNSYMEACVAEAGLDPDAVLGQGASEGIPGPDSIPQGVSESDWDMIQQCYNQAASRG